MKKYGLGRKRYRKKPVDIWAECFNPAHIPTTEFRLPDGVRGTTYQEISSLLGTSGCSTKPPYWSWEVLGVVDTLEGRHVAEPGDMIITGVNGEIYPCKPDIFLKTYELVMEVKADVEKSTD
uniref:Uncharacterized protein n=1 Tax=viral metagenome TaxID=1070528 RepID=A0A6M3KJ65_9ZZZZ